MRVEKMIQNSFFDNITLLTNDPLAFSPWDLPQITFLNPFSGFDKSKTPPVIFQQMFYSHRYQYGSYIPVYTDGSKSDEHVGCGVVIGSDIDSYRLESCCSVFTAELTAILCALQKISLSTRSKFCIYSDSMSSLQTLSNFHCQIHPVVHEIFILLRTIQNQGFSILFCWVPSHVGIFGNELADKAARDASLFLLRPLAFCDIKRSFANFIYKSWQETWDQKVNNKLHAVKPVIGLWSALPLR
ncbi:ribonuclease H1-like [Argiope bruennichi]|uniref:ribonuclease H1-like n=1 Tax=Argiope bruennichi TaxID=94029 RepID=UPI002494FD29|nr:ribonuclease H1-like [Argiope bruennichi]